MTTAFLYIFASICWGLSYLAIGITVHVIPPFMGGALRLTIASMFFAICVLIRGKSIKISLAELKKIVILATILQALPFAFLFWGEQRVEPALAGILVSAVPIFVVLISIFLKREQEGIRLKGTGVVIGFFGIITIFSPYLNLNDLSLTGGSFAIIATALCYAVGNILLSKWMFSIDRWANISLQGVFASLILWFFSFLTEQHPPITLIFEHTDVLIALLYLGILSSGVAWIASFHLVEKLGSIGASSVAFPMALISILADVIYFKRPPTIETIIGTSLIFFGVFVVQFTPLIIKRLKS